MVERIFFEPWYNFGEEIYQSCGRALHERLLGEIEAEFVKYGWGNLDERVRRGLLKIPRHRFVPPEGFDKAYRNKIVALDWEVNGFRYELTSSASEPAMVCLMTQLVLPEVSADMADFKALEVGCGTGYQLAMLKEVGFGEVYGVEINERLVREARQVLDETGSEEVHLICGDGKEGLLDYAPFDAILVTAAVRDDWVVDELIKQLKVGGKLVLPRKVGWWMFAEERLKLYTRGDRIMQVKDLGEVGFVGLQ